MEHQSQSVDLTLGTHSMSLESVFHAPHHEEAAAALHAQNAPVTVFGDNFTHTFAPPIFPYNTLNSAHHSTPLPASLLSHSVTLYATHPLVGNTPCATFA